MDDYITITPNNPTSKRYRELNNFSLDTQRYAAFNILFKGNASVNQKSAASGFIVSPLAAHARLGTNRAISNLIYVNLRSRSAMIQQNVEFRGCVHYTHIGSKWIDERPGVGGGESGFIAGLLSREYKRTSGENRRKLCH